MRTYSILRSAFGIRHLALGICVALAPAASAFETPLSNVTLSGANFVQSGGTFTISAGGTLVIEAGASFSLPANTVTWASLSKTGSSLADLATRSAADLNSGTLPDARFPATLPAASGANLTALNATQLTTGTVPVARLPIATGSTLGVAKPDGTTITVDVNGVLTATNTATGNVVGPASSVNERLALFDSTTGKLLKQSTALTVSGGMITANTAAGLTSGGSNQPVDLVPSGTASAVVTVSPGNELAGSGQIINSTDGYPMTQYQVSGVTKASAGAVRVSGLIAGSAPGDYGVRVVDGNILFSVDNGTSLAGKVAKTSGNLVWFKGITAGGGTIVAKILSASGALDYGSIAAGAEATLTLTVTGAVTTNTPTVSLGWSAALEDGLIVKAAWVSAADTVSIRLVNVSTGAVDPASVTARATVLQY